MRKHEIKCIIEGDKSDTYIQNNINIFTVSYIQKTIQESSLSKMEKLNIIEELLKKLKSN